MAKLAFLPVNFKQVGDASNLVSNLNQFERDGPFKTIQLPSLLTGLTQKLGRAGPSLPLD